MYKTTGKLKSIMALTALLSAAAATADPKSDDRPSAQAAPAQHAEPHQGQTQRPAEDHARQPFRSASPAPAQEQQRVAPQPQPQPLPDRFRPPRFAPSTAGQSQPQTQGQPQQQVQTEQRPGWRPQSQGSAALNPGSPRFNPGGSHFNSPAAPGVDARRGDVRVYRGSLPGQFRPGAYQGERGQWHGPPPGHRNIRPWHGGAWRGAYWPPVYYTSSYPLFLAALPGACATYWWGVVPYYYCNDVYYSWSAEDSGYVVTEPPPMLSDEDLGALEAEGGGADAAAVAPPAQSAAQTVSDEIFAYPRNGQSDQQQASDKYACHAWAAQQSSYDPTDSGRGTGDPDAYRRAMIACLEARGYSAG